MSSRATNPACVLALLLGSTGCFFEAPVAGLGAAQRDANTILLDGGTAEDDAGLPAADAGFDPEDAGVAPLPDATPPPDSGPRDTGQPNPTDAGFRDAMVPLDAASPDAAPMPDAGCAPFAAPTTVALAGSVATGMELDAPMLLADLDNDGTDDLVASSRHDEAFAVIARRGCGPLSISSTRSVSLAEDPPLMVVRNTSSRVIYAVGSSQVTAMVYDGTRIAFRGALRGAEVFGHMAVAPDQGGSTITVTWPMRMPGYFAYDPVAETGAFHRADAGFVSRPAYFSHPAASVPRFAVHDGSDMWLLRPDSTDREYTPAQAPVGDPIVVRFSGVPAMADPAVLVFGGRMRTLTTLTIDRTDITSSRTKLKTMRGDLSGEPIAARLPGAAGDTIRIFAELSDGSIHACELLVEGDGAVGCVAPAATETFSIAMNERSDQIGLVTAFIDGDAAPDVVIAEKGGTLHFRSGANLNVEAAPDVRLGKQIGGTPAVVRDFWAPFQQSGVADAIVVPHRDGTVSIVGVPRRASGANGQALWPQARHDAYRAAFFP